MPSEIELEDQLIEKMASFHYDPLGFVMYAYPWGQGELRNQKGPRKWQAEFLRRLGKQLLAKKKSTNQVIREAVASGNGPGKSTLVAWIVDWGMSTSRCARVVVTANTGTQLKTKTWPEINKWFNLSINRHWFDITATQVTSTDPDLRMEWRADAIPWNKTRPEASAGLHNSGKRLILLFDEASAIDDIIWDTAEGAQTDEYTEIIWGVFGNPTRNSGRFFECFHKRRARWSQGEPVQIDSSKVEGTNKELFKQWIDDWGEDSDFVRVHMKGLFPNAGDLQFIPTDWVHAAQKRQAISNIGDPLIMGIDVARGGSDYGVVRFRRGLDAQTIPPIRIPGSEIRDSMKFMDICITAIQRYHPDYIFGDATGIGAGVMDGLRRHGYKVEDVNFGEVMEQRSPYKYRRDYMWGTLKDALKAGLAIDSSETLETDLTQVEYGITPQTKVLLESKESMKSRGLASPDEGDALALTYARPVAPLGGRKALGHTGAGRPKSSWDHLDRSRYDGGGGRKRVRS